MTTGSQDALGKAFDMLLGEGDSLLCEAPTYSGSLAYLQAIPGLNLAGVRVDEDGLIPQELERILSEWDSAHGLGGAKGWKRPKVLYTIPTGSNPTGVSLSAERRPRVLEIAQEFDLLVLEDDPYYWLNYGERARESSLLSKDTDSRVLRFDSFSKTLSSGLRLGFATGPPELIERLDLHSQATTLHTSGPAQALVSMLFDRWEETHDSSAAGFRAHADAVTEFYRHRRDHFLKCAEEHLTGVAEWTVPKAGMFAWLKVIGITDTDALIKTGAMAEKVIFVPGQSFQPNPAAKSSFVRPKRPSRRRYTTGSADAITGR